MKKLLLFLASGIMITNAFAQNNSVVFTGNLNSTARVPAAEYTLNRPAKTNEANKPTANSGPRWYSTADYYDYLGLDGVALRIWFDSTVRQVFTTGLGPVNYLSFGQTIRPTGNLIWNDPTSQLGKMAITATDPYKVDSVRVEAGYVRMPAYAGVVDTLIISLSTSTLNTYWVGSQLTPTNWAAPYLPPGKDTLWTARPVFADSVNRAAFSDVSGGARQIWKVPLTAADGDPLGAGGALTTRVYTFAPPSAFNVPQGQGVNVTFTFKTGLATWNKNVDSIDKFNRFMPIMTGSANKMPYFWYDNGDRNGTALMFSDDTGRYVPSVAIEATNSVDFRYEFSTAGVLLSCVNCKDVTAGVHDVSFASIGHVYPNPANNAVNIPFTLNEKGNVTATISNLVGQSVETIDLGNYASGQSGKAVFNTSSLANGMYIYTLELNGQRMSGRFVVTH